MGLINKKNDAENELKKEDVLVALLESNETMAMQLTELSQKMEAMDRNNKKFMMTASMQKIDLLEKEIVSMRKGAISLMDNVDNMLSAMYDTATEDVKKGVTGFMKGIQDILTVFNLEEISVQIGEEYDSSLHEAKEIVRNEKYANEVIVGLIKRGSKEASSGRVIRPVQVIVNKK